MSRYNTIVIGAGLAGLTTAVQLAQAQQNVLLIASGVGALTLTSGCIDVLGYQPAESQIPVKSPAEALPAFTAQHPQHPYSLLGQAAIEAGLESFWSLVDGSLEYWGAINRNWLLPSPAGAVHPTCLAPTSLTNGDLGNRGDMLIVGFWELKDFYPSLISQNLNAQNLRVEATAWTIDTPAPLSGQMNITPIELAHAFEDETFRRQVITRLKPRASKFNRIGFPAVLGLTHHAEVLADLEARLGATVFEISTLPPSVPGRRLFDILRQTFIEAKGRLVIGSQVVDGTIEAGRVSQIRVETSNRLRTLTADNYVLATGGIFGGGIQTDVDGQVWEPIFGLPVTADTDRHHWFEQQFLNAQGQPVARYGVRANKQLNPIDQAATPIAPNLYLTGSLLAESDWTIGRTGDGVALATAAAIARYVTRGT